MPRKESMDVPEGNSPTPQDAYVILGGVTLEDFRQVMSEVWDKVREQNGLKKPEKTRIR